MLSLCDWRFKLTEALDFYDHRISSRIIALSRINKEAIEVYTLYDWRFKLTEALDFYDHRIS